VSHDDGITKGETRGVTGSPPRQSYAFTLDEDTPAPASGGPVLVELLSLLSVILGVCIVIHLIVMAIDYGP
jgi:hypothetical protein